MHSAGVDAENLLESPESFLSRMEFVYDEFHYLEDLVFRSAQLINLLVKSLAFDAFPPDAFISVKSQVSLIWKDKWAFRRRDLVFEPAPFFKFRHCTLSYGRQKVSVKENRAVAILFVITNFV